MVSTYRCMDAVVSSQYRWTVVTPDTQTHTITRKGVGDTVPAWAERSTGKKNGESPTYSGPFGDKDMTTPDNS
jgi:hypothetical protein